MHSQHIIKKDHHGVSTASQEYLHTPLFYGLPKIHKLDYPLHLNVWGCDGPTDHLSAYITHFIQLLASNLPSHIKDTKHYQPYWKTSTLPIQWPLGHSWHQVLIHIHPSRRQHSSCDSLMEKCRHLLPTNCSHPHIKDAKFDFILTLLKFMATQHNPNILPSNLILETLHWQHFLYFPGLPHSTQIFDDIHEYKQPYY